MSRVHHVFFLAAAVSAALLSVSCGISAIGRATLWTNKPEFAYYVERFNAENPGTKVILEYRTSPAEALNEGGRAPDIVVGEGLSSRKTAAAMSSMNKVFDKGKFDRSVFYPQLLEPCTYNSDIVLLPVTFNLPVIFIQKGGPQAQGMENFLITPEALKQGEKNTARFMSFSPAWNRDFLFYYVMQEGADFREAPNGRLAWNDAELKKGIRTLKDWLAMLNEQENAEEVFTEKYIHEPGYMLMNNKRISFYYSDVNSFFEIPKGKRESLDFRCFGEDGTVHIMDDVLFMGIPKKSRHKPAARNFLVWFFSAQIQKSLVESGQLKHIRGFGMARGLFAQMDLTEKELPRYYPALVGRIPPAGYLKAPPPLPAEWIRLKTEVILPWLWDAVKLDGTPPLESRLASWYQQKLEK